MSTPFFFTDIFISTLPFGRIVIPPEGVGFVDDPFVADPRVIEAPDFRYLRQLVNMDFTASVAGTWRYADGGDTGMADFSVDIPIHTETSPNVTSHGWLLNNGNDPLLRSPYIKSFPSFAGGNLPGSIGTYTDGTGDHDVVLNINAPGPGDYGLSEGFQMCKNITPSHLTRFKIGVLFGIYVNIAVADVGFKASALIIPHTAEIADWYPGMPPPDFSDVDAGTIFEGNVPIKRWTQEVHTTGGGGAHNDLSITAFSMSTPAL